MSFSMWINRRQMLARAGGGFGLAALAGMLEAAEVNPLAPRKPPLPAKAKNVIYLRSTGLQLPGRPCLGSWVTYGLGTENQNLPAFVVMSDGSTKSGPPAYSSGFLPAVFQGTVFRGGESPILYLKNPDGIPND